MQINLQPRRSTRHYLEFLWTAQVVSGTPSLTSESMPVEKSKVVSGLTAMARRGVHIKGCAFLEAIGKLKSLAVDKTGTISEGRPRVTRVVSVDPNDKDRYGTRSQG